MNAGDTPETAPLGRGFWLIMAAGTLGVGLAIVLGSLALAIVAVVGESVGLGLYLTKAVTRRQSENRSADELAADATGEQPPSSTGI